MFSRLPPPTRGTRQISKTAIFPAPVKGWIKNQALAVAPPGGAEVLDNAFPTSEGCRLRGGSIKQATIGDEVTYLAPYEVGGTGSKLFATDSDSIYDVTNPADADTAVTALVTGLSSGDWSAVQFSNSAGEFLIMANGFDALRVYNGTAFGQLDDGVTYALKYDGQTANFTVGDTLTGGTSSATGTILFDDDGGTTGTLYLTGVTGTFQDNETITDGDSGSATANGAATSVYPAWSGVTTSNLSHVWKFKNRLFFIEGGSMSAWYLDTQAIGGTASELPLGGIFTHGGSLLFGATWSSDTGAGPDDFCLFVTTEGEIAVYQGTDPSSADTWAIVGVFRIGRPLHKNAWFKAGGDIAIVTDDGIVPLSAAVSKDRAALRAVAVTYPIEDAWRDTVRQRKGTTHPFSVALWQSETMLVVGVPAFSGLSKICFVANAKTGAWARYTGWDTRCVAIFQDKLYFGTSASTVMQGETEGSDDDLPYSAVILPRFDTFNSPAAKAALHARIVARGNLTYTPQLFACADYDASTPTPYGADSDAGSDKWGTGIWGTTKWGSVTNTKSSISEWASVSATGSALSPGLIITSGRTSKPDIEIIALHLQYEQGQVL